MKYITEGKLNENCKTFWRIEYWNGHGYEKIPVREEDYLRLKNDLITRSIVSYGGITMKSESVRLIADIDEFYDWSTDEIVREEDGVIRNLISSEQKTMKMAQELHDTVDRKAQALLSEAKRNGTIQNLLSKPFTEVKQNLLSSGT